MKQNITLAAYFDYSSGNGKRGPWSVCKAKITFGKSSNLVISIWDADSWMNSYPAGSQFEIPSLEEGFNWEVKNWKETMFNDITPRFDQWTPVSTATTTAPTADPLAQKPPLPGSAASANSPFNGKGHFGVREVYIGLYLFFPGALAQS